MTIDYIRKTYGVPAKRGGRVTYRDSNPNGDGDIEVKGTITGARDGHIRVRLDGDTFSRNYHPTWQIRYEAKP
jgi:hypothetical protein